MISLINYLNFYLKIFRRRSDNFFCIRFFWVQGPCQRTEPGRQIIGTSFFALNFINYLFITITT